MATLGSRNGYTRLPTADPDRVAVLEDCGDYGVTKGGPHVDRDAVMKLNNSHTYVKGKKRAGVHSPLPDRPGLFYMFGERGKYAANHISVAIASQSESEKEKEKIELTEFRPKKIKFRSSRARSGSTGDSKNPKVSRTRHKLRFDEPLLPGDTLQRVALRYNCSVSLCEADCIICVQYLNPHEQCV